jgi:hypothetical protein
VLNLRVEHPVVSPAQPAEQEQLLGETHVPPFSHGMEQIAEVNCNNNEK